jgi:hypothetical protein
VDHQQREIIRLKKERWIMSREKYCREERWIISREKYCREELWIISREK